jgi:hypothetical protein
MGVLEGLLGNSLASCSRLLEMRSGLEDGAGGLPGPLEAGVASVIAHLKWTVSSTGR